MLWRWNNHILWQNLFLLGALASRDRQGRSTFPSSVAKSPTILNMRAVSGRHKRSALETVPKMSRYTVFARYLAWLWRCSAWKNNPPFFSTKMGIVLLPFFNKRENSTPAFIRPIPFHEGEDTKGFKGEGCAELVLQKGFCSFPPYFRYRSSISASFYSISFMSEGLHRLVRMFSAVFDRNALFWCPCRIIPVLLLTALIDKMR